MKRKSIAIILLTLLILPLISIHAQEITAKIVPSYVEANPGENLDLKLIVGNSGPKEIEVTGLRVYVTSEEVFFLPIRVNLGEYFIPFDDPVKVPSGGQKEIRKTVEVPNIPLFGRFRLRVEVRTTGGSAFTYMRVGLRHSKTSLGVFFLLILLIILILYAAVRLVKGRLSSLGRFNRTISRVDALLSERNKLIELVRKLEEKRREGKIGESEYRKLREEYEESLSKVHEQLEVYRGSIRSMLSNIEEEMSRLRKEANEVKARIEVGDMSKKEGKRVLKEKEKAIRSLEERARILRDRLEKMEVE